MKRFAQILALPLLAMFCALLMPASRSDAQLLAANTALFRLTVAGQVDDAEADLVHRSVRSAIGDYGFRLMGRDELANALQKPNPTITDLCEENDLACIAGVADKLGVSYIVTGVIERADQRLAIDLRLYERGQSAPGKGGSGAFTKQFLEYYSGGKNESIEKVSRRIVGKLLSRNGFMTVSTNVQGAEIYVDGNKSATYPLSAPIVLPVGHHKVSIKKDGYIEFNGDIDITVEDTTQFKGALKPLPFTISVDSQPTGASVYLGETNIGYTPIANYQVMNFAKAPLKLVMNQYFEYKADIDIIPGGNFKNSVVLKPQFGDLLFVTEAIDAKVLMDGKFVGNTPMQVLERVGMGKHTVELQNPNYYPFKQTIEVLPGEKNRFVLSPQARYGRLSVSTNVERAGVYLNDQFIGYSPIDDFVKVKPGSYKARVSKQNYFDFTGQVTLTAGKTSVLPAELLTQLGSLELSSNVAGAKVYLNDRYLGDTPLKNVDSLTFGEYQLTMTKGNYFDYSQKINIKAGRVNNHFAEMITTLGKLKVECNVKGVQIFLGDKLLGMTPADIVQGLQPGDYALRLTKEGYEPYNGTISIKSNEMVQRTVDMKPTTSAVSVASTPSGASVYVNGKELGVTPVSLSLKTGDYTVSVRRKGYTEYKSKVTVYADRPSVVQANLTPKPFELQVNTTPRGAKVELDGVFVGATPVTYRGSNFGQHTLRIGKSGFRSVEKSINLSPGTRTRANVVLKPVAGK